MRKRLFYSKRETSSTGVIAFVSVLGLAIVAIGAGVFFQRDADFALVLATAQDCRRAFDDDKCGAIVANAIAIHTSSAPRYGEERVCEMTHGQGACSPVKLFNATFYAPTVAVVAVARGAGDDAKGLVPLYLEPKARARQDGRRVFYHGIAVGVLHQRQFGGAGISQLTDLAGQPLTSDAVRKLRRS
ncbi:MAG: DUF1190 domain-containing protein [Micropepsaceae bacterium]